MTTRMNTMNQIEILLCDASEPISEALSMAGAIDEELANMIHMIREDMKSAGIHLTAVRDAEPLWAPQSGDRVAYVWIDHDPDVDQMEDDNLRDWNGAPGVVLNTSDPADDNPVYTVEFFAPLAGRMRIMTLPVAALKLRT